MSSKAKRDSKPTIRDVAKLSGVSVTTVSRILNKDKRYPQSTVRRVYQAVKDLDYVPSRSARSLRTQQTHTVGLLFHSVDNPVFAAYIHGIEKQLSESGYSVIVAQTQHIAAERQLTNLTSHNVDGMIVYSEGLEAEELERLSEAVPIVQIGSRASHFLDCVRTDNVFGVELGVRHLVDQGSIRIAFVGGNLNFTSGRERLRGFEEAMQATGLQPDPRLIRVGRYESWFGYDSIRELFSSDTLPDAVIAANNEVGMGVLGALYDLGIEVGDHFKLLVFSDVAHADFFNPPLTFISEKGTTVGIYAAELLLSRMDPTSTQSKHNPGVQEILVKPELHAKASTLGRSSQRDRGRQIQTSLGGAGM